MSGPSVGGGGRGDPFGNIFGSGGDKQVYPPAPPGYKYVDLNIPQAPPGYSVAKMSNIANNQSTPAPAYGAPGAYGNAGLGGRGIGGRTAYQYNVHSPEGIRERAAALLADKAQRANAIAELQGLTPQYQIPGQPAPITPYATVNPGPGNTTTAAAPVATPAAVSSQPLNPAQFPNLVRKPPAFHSQYQKGTVEYARDRLAFDERVKAAQLQAVLEATGQPPVGTAPVGAAPGPIQLPPIPGAPVAPRPVPASAPVPAPVPVPGPSSAAQPPAASPDATSYAPYIPHVLQDIWSRLMADPPNQNGAMGPSGIIPPNAITAPDTSAPPAPAQEYDPINDGREGDD